jgi:hypothetical protein
MTTDERLSARGNRAGAQDRAALDRAASLHPVGRCESATFSRVTVRNDNVSFAPKTVVNKCSASRAHRTKICTHLLAAVVRRGLTIEHATSRDTVAAMHPVEPGSE